MSQARVQMSDKRRKKEISSSVEKKGTRTKEKNYCTIVTIVHYAAGVILARQETRVNRVVQSLQFPLERA